MARKLSQVYDVDNRYREAKGVADNVDGTHFLQDCIAKDITLGSDCTCGSRRSADRLMLPETG